MTSPRRTHPFKSVRVLAGVALAAVTLSGCSVLASPRSQQPATTAAASRSSIDRLTATAQQRYDIEAQGAAATGNLHRLGSDPGLLAALRSGNPARLRSYVNSNFNSVWYHWHISRMRIVQGQRVLADAGVPFVVAPSTMPLRDAHGRTLATLEVSIQDEIGFVRYMHRNYPVDVVVRGSGAKHVRSSLPAAATARLPDSGSTTLAGRRYKVRSFTRPALGNETVKVWILQRA